MNLECTEQAAIGISAREVVVGELQVNSNVLQHRGDALPFMILVHYCAQQTNMRHRVSPHHHGKRSGAQNASTNEIECPIVDSQALAALEEPCLVDERKRS